MGLPMALNLAKFLAQNGQPALLVWNRTLSKLPAESASIRHARSVREVASCDIVITSLANDTVAEELFEELLAGARDKAAKKTAGGTIFVEASTLFPATSGSTSSSWLYGLVGGALIRGARM